MTLFGWDSSDYDWARGPMNLEAAKRDGITWFTHKATEGTGTRHKHLGEGLNRARAAGLEFVGAYHVVRTGDVAAQVRYMLAYLDQAVPWWREFPGFFLQVDLEKWDYDQVSAATGKAFAAALVKAQPKKVITYASRGMYGDQLAGIVTPLWNAAYGTNPAVHYPVAYPGDSDRLANGKASGWVPYSGQTPVMWQYGSTTRIGTQPTCDANAFRGTLADLRKLITGTDEGGSTMDQKTEDNVVFTLLDGGEGLPVHVRLQRLEQATDRIEQKLDHPLVNVDLGELASAVLATSGFADAIATAVADKLAARLKD